MLKKDKICVLYLVLNSTKIQASGKAEKTTVSSEWTV